MQKYTSIDAACLDWCGLSSGCRCQRPLARTHDLCRLRLGLGLNQSRLRLTSAGTEDSSFCLRPVSVLCFSDMQSTAADGWIVGRVLACQGSILRYRGRASSE